MALWYDHDRLTTKGGNMAKFEVMFSQKVIYQMSLAAKNEDEVEEKVLEKLDSLNQKQLEKLIVEHADFEIDHIEKSK
jgi:transcriptional/translational regulatory protein YebC/TACO1